MAFCGTCNSRFSGQQLKVSCVDCKRDFHAKCVKMTKADIDTLESEKLDWRCFTCSTERRRSMKFDSACSSGTVTLEDIMKELCNLKDTQKEHMNGFNEAIELLNSKVDELHKTVTVQSTKMEAYITRMNELEWENQRLKNAVEELQSRVEDSEQYSRVNCVEIHGVPRATNENVLAVVRQVGTAIGFQLSDEMIDNCHRLGGSREDRPAGVIVKFVRRFDKEKFLTMKRQKKDLTTRHLGFASDTPVYINEALCPARRRLYAQARQIKKEKHYKYIWLRNGKILLRKDDGGPVVAVTQVGDLQKL